MLYTEISGAKHWSVPWIVLCTVPWLTYGVCTMSLHATQYISERKARPQLVVVMAVLQATCSLHFTFRNISYGCEAEMATREERWGHYQRPCCFTYHYEDFWSFVYPNFICCSFSCIFPPFISITSSQCSIPCIQQSWHLQLSLCSINITWSCFGLNAVKRT